MDTEVLHDLVYFAPLLANALQLNGSVLLLKILEVIYKQPLPPPYTS